MTLRHPTAAVLLAWAMVTGAGSPAHTQKGAETFTATATVTTANAAVASTAVTIDIQRKMPQGEADALIAAFKRGGVQALRAALVGVPPTGSVRLGTGAATPTRLTLERPTDKGRLLTIVTDQPLVFLGAGLPGPKTSEKAGYDLAVIDIEVDAMGRGSGTLSPAAKITIKQGVFVVDDYAAALVRLTDVRRVE